MSMIYDALGQLLLEAITMRAISRDRATQYASRLFHYFPTSPPNLHERGRPSHAFAGVDAAGHYTQAHHYDISTLL